MAGTVIMKGNRCSKGTRRCKSYKGHTCVKKNNNKSKKRCIKGHRKCVDNICYLQHKNKLPSSSLSFSY